MSYNQDIGNVVSKDSFAPSFRSLVDGMESKNLSFYNQDVHREERERNQRERQQISRPAAPNQVSASLLFDTPIKKEKQDETSKMIEKTLGDFNQVSKYLMSDDYKQIIGISTHEIQKKNKMEDDKAKIEQILREIKGPPPITGLDNSSSASSSAGSSDSESESGSSSSDNEMIETENCIAPTTEVDNPVGSWNLMSFMQKDAFKATESLEQCAPVNDKTKIDSSCKSKTKPISIEVAPCKQNVSSKENYKPIVQSVEKELKSISEVVPSQLICSIDCHMLKRIPKVRDKKKLQQEQQFVPRKKMKTEKQDRSKQEDTNGDLCLSPPSSSQKVSSLRTSQFSPKEGKSQQKSDISSPRVPSSALKKDPSSSPPSSLHTNVTLTSTLPPTLPSTNRSQPPPQSGPSFPAVHNSNIPPSLSVSETLNGINDQESSVDCCLANAKRLKHSADGENERTAKFCKYIDSVLYFVLTCSAKEVRNDNPMEVISMYRDTHNLLQYTTENFRKGCSSSTSASDNKLLALSHRCNSVINSKLYRLRARERNENNRLIKDVKTSTNSNPGEVSIPASSFHCMKKQLDLYKILDAAYNSWVQVDGICQKHPSCKAFFDTLDKECIPLSLTSSVENLVTYVRTGLNLLR